MPVTKASAMALPISILIFSRTSPGIICPPSRPPPRICSIIESIRPRPIFERSNPARTLTVSSTTSGRSPKSRNRSITNCPSGPNASINSLIAGLALSICSFSFVPNSSLLILPCPKSADSVASSAKKPPSTPVVSSPAIPSVTASIMEFRNTVFN